MQHWLSGRVARLKRKRNLLPVAQDHQRYAFLAVTKELVENSQPSGISVCLMDFYEPVVCLDSGSGSEPFFGDRVNPRFSFTAAKSQACQIGSLGVIKILAPFEVGDTVWEVEGNDVAEQKIQT